MDATDFTMYKLSFKDIGGCLPLIEEGVEDVCDLTFYKDKLVSANLPDVVSRRVIYTEDASRSSTSGTATKPEKLGVSTEIQVPNDI